MGTKYCGQPTVINSDCAVCLDGPCESPCGDDCGCTPSGPACPTPFYDEAPAVQQSNCDPTYVTNFYASIKSSTAWNIPACGSTAVLKFGCIQSILIGSNIWNGNYGYFEVTAYDSETGNVTIQNNCVEGNAAIGTSVPKCSEFVVTPPPCCTGGSGDDPLLFPYVAIDFTAQANGACQQITVTSVNGIAVGKNVQIGSGTYRVSSVDGTTLITICNDGAGIAPGTSVIAKNAAGNYQYPIILIDTNPCTNPTTQSGVVLVCDNNISTPLTGAAVGSVLVLTDVATGEAEYQVTGQPTFTCTILTQPVVTSNGVATYTLVVADSTPFSPTDLVQLGSRTDRFTVTSVPDGTHIIGTLDPVPSGIEVIPVGTSVCLVGCCEELEIRVDALDEALADEITLRDFNQNQLAIKQASNNPANASGALTDGQTLTSNNGTVSVTNNAALAHNLVVTVAIDCQLEGSISDGASDAMTVDFRLALQQDGGLFQTQARRTMTLKELYMTGARNDHLSAVLTYAIAGGGTVATWVVQAKVTVASIDPADTYTITTLQPRIFLMGVSV